MTKIGLISDVHAAPEPVSEAMDIFAAQGVDEIFCAGDIAGYNSELEPTIKLLQENHCRTVAGNHDLLYLDHLNDEACEGNTAVFLQQLPPWYETVLEDKRVYLVHAEPPDKCHGGIKLRDKDGNILPDRVDDWRKKLDSFEYDVLVVGHTHQVFARIIGKTLVINPGSSVYNHSCAVLTLPQMHVEMFALSGKKIKKTWNWGQHMLRTSC